MKRLLGVLAVMGVLAAVTMSHRTPTAQAAPDPAKKQLVCHVSDDHGAHIIYVSNHAVPAHLANHGDCLINGDNQDLVGQPCDPTDVNNNDICDIQP